MTPASDARKRACRSLLGHAKRESVPTVRRCQVVSRLMRQLPTAEAYAFRAEVLKAGGPWAGAPHLLWDNVIDLEGEARKVRGELTGMR